MGGVIYGTTALGGMEIAEIFTLHYYFLLFLFFNGRKGQTFLWDLGETQMTFGLITR